MAAKTSLRSVLGLSQSKMEAVKVYRKDMAFDHADVKAESWIVVTPDGNRVHANTYDGNLGRNFDASQFTYPIPEPKAWAKKLKGYTEVPTSSCPFVISATGTPTPEAPNTDEATDADVADTESTDDIGDLDDSEAEITADDLVK